MEDHGLELLFGVAGIIWIVMGFIASIGYIRSEYIMQIENSKCFEFKLSYIPQIIIIIILGTFSFMGVFEDEIPKWLDKIDITLFKIKIK